MLKIRYFHLLRSQGQLLLSTRSEPLSLTCMKLLERNEWTALRKHTGPGDLASAGRSCNQGGAYGCRISFDGQPGVVRVQALRQGLEPHPFRAPASDIQPSNRSRDGIAHTLRMRAYLPFGTRMVCELLSRISVSSITCPPGRACESPKSTAWG